MLLFLVLLPPVLLLPVLLPFVTLRLLLLMQRQAAPQLERSSVEPQRLLRRAQLPPFPLPVPFPAAPTPAAARIVHGLGQPQLRVHVRWGDLRAWWCAFRPAAQQQVCY